MSFALRIEMHLRSEKFKHIEMFSNTIHTAAFFRSSLRGCLDLLFTHQQKPASPHGTVRAGVQRGKVPAFPMLNGITPTDHIHLAILTQFIALHILQK